jgi:hypothetical protein
MISIKEQVTQQLDTLSETGLEQVAKYIAFLKYQERFQQILQLDESQLASLYAEFAEEDRDLAEAGMSDYAAGLAQEDTR